MKKTLQKILKDPRVEEISDESADGDGYWVYLKAGYINREMETHCCHEWNMKDLLRSMKDIVECDCESCQAKKSK